MIRGPTSEKSILFTSFRYAVIIFINTYFNQINLEFFQKPYSANIKQHNICLT